VDKESRSGLLLIDKPSGPTSHDVVAAVRGFLGKVKVGHTGTLDPMASGLLVVLVGSTTRLAPYVRDDPKIYEGSILLGVCTDSMDTQGEVTCEKPYGGGPREAREALASLLGELEQVPPMYSAVKHRGRPLYHYARKGQEVARKSRRVRLYRVEMTGYRDLGERAEVDFVVECSPGTYVRDLAARVGCALSCGGTLSRLRRTAAGPFRVEDASSLEAVGDELARGWEVLLPAEAALTGYARVEVTGAACGAVRNGAPVTRDMVSGADAGMALGDVVAVFGGGTLLGVHRVTSLEPFESRAARMM